MKYELIVDDLKIKVFKKIGQKNIYLKVKPPYGDAVVSAPMRVSKKDIEKFVESKSDWLNKARLKFSYKKDLKLEDGDSVYLWGKKYLLRVIDSKSFDININGDEIIMEVSKSLDFNEKMKFLNEFYRKELKKSLPIVINKCEAITGLCANEYRLRIMKSRWGTCNITKKRIWLNVNLAKYPKICLYYVLVHELVHLIETNHTPRFHNLVKEYFPKYKEAQNYLKRFY